MKISLTLSHVYMKRKEIRKIIISTLKLYDFHKFPHFIAEHVNVKISLNKIINKL
jgi:hypothetical protein